MVTSDASLRLCPLFVTDSGLCGGGDSDGEHGR